VQHYFWQKLKIKAFFIPWLGLVLAGNVSKKRLPNLFDSRFLGKAL